LRRSGIACRWAAKIQHLVARGCRVGHARGLDRGQREVASCAGRLGRDVESPPVWSLTGTDGRIRAVGPFVAFATG
jgi:hypothetical protein